jgi:hypothetical protein
MVLGSRFQCYYVAALALLEASCRKGAPGTGTSDASAVDAPLSKGEAGTIGDLPPSSGPMALHHVADGPGHLGAELFESAAIVEDYLGPLVEITSQHIEPIPHWLDGVLPYRTASEMRDLVGVVGSWPTSPWLLTRRGANLKFSGEAWRRSGSRWAKAAEAAPYWEYWDAVPYQGGLLAVVRDSRGVTTPRGDRVVPTRFDLIGAKGTHPEFDTPTADCPCPLSPLRILELQRGDVFVVGYLCPSLGGGLAVEHWAPGSREGHIEHLPMSTGRSSSDDRFRDASLERLGAFAATSANESWMTGKAETDAAPWFARFDGNHWQSETPPPGMHDASLGAAATDGSRWIIDFPDDRSGKLWHQRTGGPWEMAPLPMEFTNPTFHLQVEEVWAFPGDDFWVMGSIGGGKRTLLFRNRPTQQVQYLSRD